MNVAINASGGGNDTGYTGNSLIEKNITLDISKEINNKLKDKVNTLMLRNNDEDISYDERIKKLINTFPDKKDTIVISNTLNKGGESGIEIIYPLNFNDELASLIASKLSKYNDVKYYQYRYPTDPTKDYYYLTRNTNGYQTIIIRYGYVDNQSDANIIKNNYINMADDVADAILDYLNIEDKSTNNIYTVKSGDTLYSIAKKYHISVNKLKEINNLNSNIITINQTLEIPNNTYIVKKGDTLYSIAKNNNTTVDKIKEMNNLSSNNLSINQELII